MIKKQLIRNVKEALLLTLFLLVFSASLSAQNLLSISGHVVDDNNEPAIGVSVLIQGTSKGTTTDINGDYSLQSTSNALLTFSFSGLKEVSEPVNGRTRIDVAMSADINQLDEVVVVGYGVMKKSDVTGAVSSIKADALQKTPASSITQALQGRAAGVTVNANSGQPGAAATIRIRGIGTLNNSDPIFVVDGIIVNDIAFLSSNDIESTEILKDASAAAIYGSRGANGVVLITTKKGKEKEGKISFDAYVGVQNRWRKLDVMKSHEFAQTMINFNDVRSEINAYNGGVTGTNKGFNYWLSAYRLGTSPYYPVIYDNWHSSIKNPNGFDYSSQETDWQDEVFVSNAVVQSYSLSFNGGNDKQKYALSASYYDQDGTVIGSYYQRFTLRANTSYQIRKWLNVGENITYMTSTQRMAMNNSGSAGASILTAALAMAPWDPTHYPTGSVNSLGEDLSGRPAAASNFKNVTNPFSMVETSHPNDYTDRVVGDVYMDLTPFKGFTLRSSASLDLSNPRSRTFNDKYEYSSYDKRDKNFLTSSLSRYSTFMVQNIATYMNSIGKHSFSVMAGQTTEEWNYYSLGNSGASILNPVESNWYLSQTTEDNTNPAGDNVDRTRMFSLLGRAHYTYDDRYMLTVNFRADASSKFPEHMWGYFPSAAVGWVISKESFMKDIHFLDNLKIRVGWGQLGNQSSVGSGDFLQTINSGMYFSSYVLGQGTAAQSGGSVVDGQSAALGASVNTWVNSGGKWEITEQWNAAVDFSFFSRKLSGTVDFFRRDTKEMFLYTSAPAYTGNLFSPKANVGTVRNDGVEISLEHQNNFNKFYFTVGGNMSFIKNNLVALNGGDAVYGDRVISTQGMALFSYYGYEYLGLFGSNEEVAQYLHSTPTGTYSMGDAKYRDVNGDGKINDDDRVNLGNPFPWLTYGINLSGEYRGFDMQVFFQGVYGNKLYNAQREKLEGPGNESVMSTAMRNAWTPSTPNGNIPNPRNAVNFYTSSRFVEDGSYFRLKNIQLGYTIPKELTQRAKIDRLRVYVSANNLLTFTNYTGYDPEVGSGVDYGNYPQSLTVSFGCNIDF